MYDLVYVRVCSGPDSVVRGVGFHWKLGEIEHIWGWLEVYGLGFIWQVRISFLRVQFLPEIFLWGVFTTIAPLTTANMWICMWFAWEMRFWLPGQQILTPTDVQWYFRVFQDQDDINVKYFSHRYDLVYVRGCSGPDYVVRGVGFTENWAK